MTDKDGVVLTQGLAGDNCRNRAGAPPLPAQDDSPGGVRTGQETATLLAQDDSPRGAAWEKSRDPRDRSTGGRGGDQDGALRFHTREMTANRTQMTYADDGLEETASK